MTLTSTRRQRGTCLTGRRQRRHPSAWLRSTSAPSCSMWRPSSTSSTNRCSTPSAVRVVAPASDVHARCQLNVRHAISAAVNSPSFVRLLISVTRDRRLFYFSSLGLFQLPPSGGPAVCAARRWSQFCHLYGMDVSTVPVCSFGVDRNLIYSESAAPPKVPPGSTPPPPFHPLVSATRSNSFRIHFPVHFTVDS